MLPHNVWGIFIVLGLAFLLFSRPGRISGLMEDLGKGIRGFRKGLSEPEEKKSEEPPRQVPDQSNEDRAQ
ncbi:MAG: twin-arginine translocase TatA/TatE family subunit [Terricaulis sp.]